MVVLTIAQAMASKYWDMIKEGMESEIAGKLSNGAFVVVPIVGPVLMAMGVDPIWLGVLIAVNLQTSFLTPPFGFALFYLRGVAPPQVTTGEIYRGVLPFIGLQLALLAALLIWPGLATWLPSQL